MVVGLIFHPYAISNSGLKRSENESAIFERTENLRVSSPFFISRRQNYTLEPMTHLPIELPALLPSSIKQNHVISAILVDRLL